MTNDLDFILGQLTGTTRAWSETPEEEVREYRKLIEAMKRNPKHPKRHIEELEHCLAEAEERIEELRGEQDEPEPDGSVCPNCEHNDGLPVERNDGTAACDKCSIACRGCGNYVDPDHYDITHRLCDRCSPDGEHQRKRRHLLAFIAELRARRARMDQ